MGKDVKIFLQHILECIEAIEEYVSGMKRSDFYNSRPIIDAVVRRIEIIGEAAKNIPAGFRNKYIHIPWQNAIDMRNFLIHEYFGVDKKQVWDTIKKDLPGFKKEIEILLK